MDVFVIPIGSDRYELYCEVIDDDGVLDETPATGVFGRAQRRFKIMLRAAEARQRGEVVDEPEKEGWLGRLQGRAVAWIAERIAEQRLLWNLRRQSHVTAVHPEDMTFEQAMALIRHTLQRDYERHRVWFVVDTLLFIASGIFFFVPGPNVLAYYLAFRFVGHWLSMRGALQGLRKIAWSGRACPPLSELRAAAALEPEERDRHVHDIAVRLRLPHLPTFFERVAIEIRGS
jgi:hypothetical protein